MFLATGMPEQCDCDPPRTEEMHRNCAGTPGRADLCVPIGLSWEDFRPGAAALSFNARGGLAEDGGRTELRESEKQSPGNTFRAPTKLRQKVVIGPNFQVTWVITSFYSAWLESSCNQWIHEWHGKMSFFPCAQVMGTGCDMHGMRQKAMAMALTTTRFGFSGEYERLWVSLYLATIFGWQKLQSYFLCRSI